MEHVIQTTRPKTLKRHFTQPIQQFSISILMGFLMMTVAISMSTTAQADVTNPKHYIGNAYDLKTKKFLYSEEYKERVDADLNLYADTLYRNAEGDIIARKTIEFRKDLNRPSFRLEDERDGYLEGADVDESSIRLFYRKSETAETKEVTLASMQTAVLDAGFHYFIVENWEALIQGRNIELDFIVPHQQDYFRFDLTRETELTYEGREAVVFRLQIATFFLRIFVEPIRLTYDKTTQQLLVFEGISNINDAAGKSHVVRMELEYPEKAEASLQ